MPIAPHHLANLKDIAGSKAFCDDAHAMAPYLKESRDKYFGKSPLVLKPDSREKVSEIVLYCHQNDIIIVPQGGNSGLVGGGIPDQSGDMILLSLSRMNRVRASDPANQSITVEAGAILKDVQDRAKEMDCLFPLSLAAEGSCQIGGNISTNAGGVNVLQYGGMRDLVLGLEVVLAGGEIWHGLSGLRKDNTGYDLKQLFIGAEGTLGIITAATLKLSPYPHQKQTAFVAVPDPAAAVSLLDLGRKISGDCLTAFEILPRFGLDIVTRHLPSARDPLAASYDWYVLMECSTSLDKEFLDLERVLERLLEKGFEKQLVLDGVVAQNQTQSRDLWTLRESLSEMQKLEGGSIKHDVSLPLSAIAEFLSRANTAVEQAIPGARPVPFGHIGDGNIHYNISQPLEMDKQEFLDHWEEINRIVHDIVHDFGGSFSAEHGIGRMKVADMKRYKSAAELEVMRGLKKALDAKNILNPGVILDSE